MKKNFTKIIASFTIALALLFTAGVAHAARTQSSWLFDSAGYIFPTQNPVNVLISGTNRYLNFGTFSGSSGYGIRDNTGVMEYKNSGGSWTSLPSGGVIGGSGTAGMLTAFSGASTLTATSAPTASYYTATSTTATSTFAGSIYTKETQYPNQSGGTKNGNYIQSVSQGSDFVHCIGYNMRQFTVDKNQNTDTGIGWCTESDYPDPAEGNRSQNEVYLQAVSNKTLTGNIYRRLFFQGFDKDTFLPTYTAMSYGVDGFVLFNQQNASTSWTADTAGVYGTEKFNLQAGYLKVEVASTSIGTAAIPLTTLMVGSVSSGTAEATNKGIVQIGSGQANLADNGLEFKASSSGSGYGHRLATVYDGASNVDFYFQQRQGSPSWTTVGSIQGSSGFWGFGTTTPAGLVNIASTLPRLYISDTDSATNNKHWFMENNAGVLSFGTTTDGLSVSNSRGLSITNGGFVGVNSTSPLSQLYVKSTVDQTEFRTDGVQTVDWILQRTDNATASGALSFRGNDNGIDWQVATNNSVGSGLEFNGAGAANLMYLTTTGFLGIATTTPPAPLSVQAAQSQIADFNRNSDNGAWLTLSRNTSIRGYLGYENSTAGGGLGTGTLANSLILRATGALHLISAAAANGIGITIDSSANTGIGTTTPGAKLHVYNNSSTLAIIQNGSTGAVGNGSNIFFENLLSSGATHFAGFIGGIQQSTTLNTGDIQVSTYSGGAPSEVMRWTSGGLVGIGTTTPFANFQVTAAVNATTTAEIGRRGSNKGTCIKLYDATGVAWYYTPAVGTGTLTPSATSCASVAGF